MKTSVVLLALTATLASASPLYKRKIVTIVQPKIVTEYRYPDGALAPAPTRPASVQPGVFYVNNAPSSLFNSTTSTVPTTTSTIAPVIEPTTTPTPTPSPEPTPEPAPEPAPEPQPAPEAPAPIDIPVELPVDLPVNLPTQAPVQEPVEQPSYPQPQPQPEPAPAPEPEPAPAPAPVPSQPDTNSGNSGSGGDFITAALNAHNSRRAKHGVGAVQWSESLASYAAQSASSCVFEHDLSPGGGGYGQNIAMYGNSGGLPSTAEAIDQAAGSMWYDSERPLYTYYGGEPDMSDFHAWGHFTQIVWKDTTQIGCAVQKCGSGTLASYATYYTVCNYGPAGNFGGRFAANVPAPISS